MGKERYFIDARVGCVAVRDRKFTDDTPGLHSDTKGVVNYWSGVSGRDGWEVPQPFLDAAKLTCDELNRIDRNRKC